MRPAATPHLLALKVQGGRVVGRLVGVLHQGHQLQRDGLAPLIGDDGLQVGGGGGGRAVGRQGGGGWAAVACRAGAWRCSGWRQPQGTELNPPGRPPRAVLRPCGSRAGRRRGCRHSRPPQCAAASGNQPCCEPCVAAEGAGRARVTNEHTPARLALVGRWRGARFEARSECRNTCTCWRWR